MMLLIVLLSLTLQLAAGLITLTHDNYTVTLSLTTALPLDHSTSNDTCRKLYVGTAALFHLNSEGTAEHWLTTDFTTSHLLYFPQTATCHVIDFQVKTAQNFFTFLNAGNSSLLKYKLQGGLKTPSFHQVTHFTGSMVPTQYFESTSKSYLYYRNASSSDTVRKFNPQANYTMSHANGSINMSPDRSVGALVGSDSTVYIYDIGNGLTIRNTYYPGNSVPNGTTGGVSFDSTSSFMIVETDSYNDIVIYDITLNSIFFSISHPDIIHGAAFIQNNTDYFIILAQNGNYLVDTRNAMKYSVPEMVSSSSVFDVDFDNMLYQCSNNTINQYSFQFAAPLASTPSTPSIPSTNSSSASSQVSVEQDFFFAVELTEAEQKTVEAIDTTFAFSFSIIKQLVVYLIASPLAIYFLGSINFFTMSSLYVLLNFPIPKDVYEELSFVYRSLNGNFFKLIGVDYAFQQISPEKVDRARPLFFKVSSDIMSFNSELFIVFAFNFGLIFIVQLVLSQLRTCPGLRKIFRENKWGFIYGQIINTIVSFTLPWVFMTFHQTGFGSFGSKLNLAMFFGTLFIAVHFPIVYFFELVNEQKEQLLEKRRQAEIEQAQANKQTKIARIILEIVGQKKKQRPVALTFEQLLTAQVWLEWFVCFANFLYPLLVLLASPVYFLMGIAVFTLVSLLVALKSFKRNKNGFFLTLYPFLFHLCFIVFYYSQSQKLIVYTEIFCLGVLLLGSLHHFITMTVALIASLCKLIKNFCNSNQVEPSQPDNSQANSQQQSSSSTFTKTNVKSLVSENHKSSKQVTMKSKKKSFTTQSMIEGRDIRVRSLAETMASCKRKHTKIKKEKLLAQMGTIHVKDLRP